MAEREKPPEPGLRDRISQYGKPPPAPPKRVLGAELPAPPPPKAVHPPRQPTLTGVAPPPSGSAPEPPPRSVSPIPWDKRSGSPEARQDAERHGDRVVDAPVSTPLPTRHSAEPPWWRTAAGMVKVIGASAAGLGVATGSLVAIIGALRQPTDPKLREDVEATRTEVVSLRKYLAEKDAARALELEKRFDAMSSRITDLDLRYPAPKPDPMRPPK